MICPAALPAVIKYLYEHPGGGWDNKLVFREALKHEENFVEVSVSVLGPGQRPVLNLDSSQEKRETCSWRTHLCPTLVPGITCATLEQSPTHHVRSKNP